MQRAAAQSFQIGAAGRRTQQEDEDAGGHDSSGGYGALLRQRANTTGGYLSGESGTTRESPNGRTVGFRLSGTGKGALCHTYTHTHTHTHTNTHLYAAH